MHSKGKDGYVSIAIYEAIYACMHKEIFILIITTYISIATYMRIVNIFLYHT